MAIGVIWYPPIDQQTYNAIKEKVWEAAIDKGMKIHAGGEAKGTWRIIEIWESREALERFIREDLHPAAHEVSGGQAPPSEPEVIFDIYFQGP